MSQRLAVVMIVLGLSGQASPAAATSIDPLLWQEMAAGADLVGVVECETAGGIVARYRVVDSWKGPAPGTALAIRTASNYWEPQFPISLVGERYVVMAYKSPPSTVVATTLGGGVPLWWRQIPHDYQLPLFQGQAAVHGDKLGVGLDYPRGLSQLKAEVLALLARKPEALEATLLQLVAVKYLASRHDGSRLDAAQLRELTGARTPRLIVGALLDRARKLARDDRHQIYRTLRRGGGSVTLSMLKQLAPRQSPWDANDSARLVRDIERRVAPLATPTRAPAPPRPFAAAVRAEALRLLGRDAPLADVSPHLDALTLHEPVPLARYLARHPADPQDPARSYVLASYFGHRCGKERPKSLRLLLGAADPMVRVAGAVYLTFEDAPAGLAELRRLLRQDGDPGVWAALTLARHGEKSALPRALKVFDDRGDGGMRGVPHRNLQKRLLVLLSNSAKGNGVPLPTSDDGFRAADWWRTHGARVKLVDPWLALLAGQKID